MVIHYFITYTTVLNDILCILKLLVEAVKHTVEIVSHGPLKLPKFEKYALAITKRHTWIVVRLVARHMRTYKFIRESYVDHD